MLGAGLVLGAFLSRVLAETAWLDWPFYRPGPAVALSLGTAAALTLIWGLAAKGQARTRAVPRRNGGASFELSASSFVPFYALILYLPGPSPDPLRAWVLLGGALALCVLLGLRGSGSRKEWPIAFLLFAVSMAAYLCTLTPAVGTRDGYELQAASATLGFAHPTGYPLFPILGRLWIALLPLGSVAWRINVLCALFAAASVPLVYGTARRVLGHRAFAVGSALLFGFSQTFWAQASQPEKYTLNALFVALILYLAFGAADPEARSPYRHLRWLGFVYGLSLTHHRTMLMLAPALIVYVLWREPRLRGRPREWAPALAVTLAPLLIYLYIPWRAYAQGWRMTVPEFLRYIAGTYYGAAVRPLDWLAPERSQMFWRFLVTQFGYPGVALGMIGLIGLGLGRKWRFLACTALAYAAYYVWGTVWYAYYNDVNSFIPNHMIFTLWMGSGAMMLWTVLSRAQAIAGGNGVLRAAFWSASALLPLWMIWTNAPQVDMSDRTSTTRWGQYVMGLDIAPQATILADRDRHPPLDYWARIERRRPDVDVVILGDEAAYVQRLDEDLAHGKTVYLARFLPGLADRYHLRSLGPLVQVSSEPLQQVGSLEGTAAAWWASPAGSAPAAGEPPLRLLGFEVEDAASVQPGLPLRLTLYWQAGARIPANYQVHLRLVGSSGQVWWTSSDHPVSGMYPTGAWKPGEIVPDWHEVPIAETLPPGSYGLEVGLFLPFSQEGLVTSDGKQWLQLERVTVTQAPSNPEIPHRLRAVAPGQWQLIGYDLAAQAPPGGRVPLTLYWQALGPLPDVEIGTRVVPASHPGAWTWAAPAKGEYPASRWPRRQTIATTHLLLLPGETGQAAIQLAVRAAGAGQAGEPIAFFPGWLASRTTVLSLPPLDVVGSPPTAPGATNFDDRILLLETDLGQRTLPPGALLEIAVRWQCLRAMESDYTLFIHVLAPDGTLKGQIDVWPRNGTYPTSQWRAGERIDDRYTLYVDPGAPPGTYQLEIGWYLLETMQRLPVLDAAGKPVDDKLLLPGLTIAR